MHINQRDYQDETLRLSIKTEKEYIDAIMEQSNSENES